MVNFFAQIFNFLNYAVKVHQGAPALAQHFIKNSAILATQATCSRSSAAARGDLGEEAGHHDGDEGHSVQQDRGAARGPDSAELVREDAAALALVAVQEGVGVAAAALHERQPRDEQRVAGRGRDAGAETARGNQQREEQGRDSPNS
jgi:hypothetical protein